MPKSRATVRLIAPMMAIAILATPALASRDLRVPENAIASASLMNAHGMGYRFQWYVQRDGVGTLIEQPRNDADRRATRFRLNGQKLAELRELLTSYRTSPDPGGPCMTDQPISILRQPGETDVRTDFGCRNAAATNRAALMEQILTLLRSGALNDVR